MTKTAIAALAVILAAACSSDGDDGRSAARERITGSFAGTVEGTGAYVAVVVGTDGDTLAYVTDGGSSVDWLDGGLTGAADRNARLGNDGGAVLQVTFSDSGASGRFARPGEELQAFTADVVREPAGLYRAEAFFADGEYVGGWIVLPDGSERGAVRRYETPLAPGTVDPTTFIAGDETFAVPGGVLEPERVQAP